MTANPEKLWAYVYDWARHPGARIGIRASASKEDAKKALAVTRGDDMCVASEPQAYVREDHANAEIAEMCQARDEEADLRREIEVDRDALRRERDALRLERDQLKAHVLGMADRETWLEGRIERLAEALYEVVVLADVAPHETPDLRAIVKVADTALAAAGKGVG
ncbi:hypothetical protein K0U83_16940 [bacterium]|nr:hypothetical protein [bacterium]